MKNKYDVYAHDVVKLVCMREVAELYGYEVSSNGFSLCPFHREKTASMRIYHDHYHCFGCGASGDVITFVRRLFDLDFVNTLKRLNSDFSLNLPINNRMTLRQSNEYKIKRRKIEEARRRERERRRRIEENYDALLGEYIRLEKNLKEYRPKRDDEELHPLFAEACRQFEYISYRIDAFDYEGGSAA